MLGLLPTLAGKYDGLACESDEAKLVAQAVGLHLRLPVNTLGSHAQPDGADACRRLLVVDLVLSDADEAQRLREVARRAYPQAEVTLLALFAMQSAKQALDIVAQQVPSRPFFEWNFLDRDGMDRVCLDIDGVCCEDPTEAQNDDGPIYRAFLDEARPLHLPKGRVGWLVTSRLEKYREHTEAWMDKWGVSFNELHMIDLPTKEARQAAKCHGTFKAQVYAGVDADLFVESNPRQAWEIALTTQKPVFCVDTMKMIDLNDPGMAYDLPKPVGPASMLKNKARGAVGKVLRRIG